MNKLQKLLLGKPFILALWFGLSLFALVKNAATSNTTEKYNNYIVYKHNFLNEIQQHSLFGPQPQYYFDLNHYGPVFALIIAPFTFLPDGISSILWGLFNAGILYLAIMKLPLAENRKLLILLLGANSMMLSSANVEVNPLIAALIIFSMVFIHNKKDFWAALMIVLGTAIKLYGIVGLAFFFFSDNKLKLVLSTFFWAVVLFVLPMFISSPAFIISAYHDWYPDLVAKNAANLVSNRAYVCVMGMISNLLKIQVPNLLVLVPALALFGASLLRIKFWQNLQYRLLLLSSTLIFTVIFSSGSEPPTYIIAFIGVGIWFMNLQRPVTTTEKALLIFALIITSFGPSDILPKYFRVNYILPYKLIALPCLLVWLKIIYEMLTRKFELEVQDYLPQDCSLAMPAEL